jgi:hypothetical protein
MQGTKIAQDERIVDANKQSQFVDSIKSEFIQTSLTSANFQLVKKLNLLSYLPQFISFVTASFFIYYILSSYSTWVLLVLGVLLLIIALGIEYSKRELINSISQKYLVKRQISYLLSFALLVLFTASMTVSYVGGDKLILETAQAPQIAKNLKIDSLNNLLQNELALIEKMSNTTWRGKVTRDANKAINASKAIQMNLLAEMSRLTKVDNEQHIQNLRKHEKKIMSFGVVLGVIACLCDLILLALLVNVKRLKYDVLLLTNVNSPKQSQNTLNGFKTHTTQHVPAEINGRSIIGFKTHNTQSVNAAEAECLNCGSAYEKKATHQKYCKSACRIEHWQKVNNKKLLKHFH